MSSQGISFDRRFSPRDWSLRVKLAVVLLVPGVLAVVLGGLRIADQAGQAAEFDRVSRFAAVQGQVETLVERVQLERLRSTAFVGDGRRTDPAALKPAIADVDAAGAAIEPAVSGLLADDPALVGLDRQSQQALARLPELRALVTSSNAPASAVISRYSDLLAQFSQLDDALLRGVNTTEANGLTSGLAGLEAARNEASLQVAIVTAAARSSDPASVALNGLAASDARTGTALATFRTALDVGQRVRYAALIAGPVNNARAGLVQSLLARSGPQPLPTATAGTAVPLYDAVIREIDASQSAVRAELTTTTTERRSTAVGLVWLNAALLLLALLIGVAVVGLTTRAMLSSLRVLRVSALDVARRRLPEAVRRMREGAMPDVDVEPVPVTTREEIGEVARAFDAVHLQAVRLAAEQATLQNNVNSMFINLSRRSQTLVDKQLQLIEELESNEQDSDQLSNLFRLDHLATRMRRNSESLLVLAGTDLGQRSSRQVPLVDVLRAAVGEIERYERIIVEQPPGVVVFGQAANDLQHLFAELLDNATSFSPPDSVVVMAADRTPDGAIIVEIADLGIGMRPDELAAANAQLGRRDDDSSVNASRQMGLFVIGRLAARHDVTVRLTSNSFGRPGTRAEAMGLTARVTLPARLLTANANTPPAPPVPASRAPIPPAAVPQPRSEQNDRAVRRSVDLFGGHEIVEVPTQDRRPAFPQRPSTSPAPRQPAPPLPAARQPAAPRPAAAQVTATDPAPEAARHALRSRSPLFNDPGTGWTRTYRPVPINWTPGPDSDVMPDDVLVEPGVREPDPASGS